NGVWIRQGKDRQTVRRVASPDGGLERIRASRIPVRSDQDELLLLADLPEDRVGDGRLQVQVAEGAQRQLQRLPEFPPALALEDGEEDAHVSLDVHVTEDRPHRRPPLHAAAGSPPVAPESWRGWAIPGDGPGPPAGCRGRCVPRSCGARP